MRTRRRRCARRGGKTHAADHAVGVAVEKRAARRVGQQRIDAAVRLALVVGRHGQRRLAHRERAIDVGDGVVARRAARRDDRVRAGRRGRAGRGRQAHAADHRVGVAAVKRAGGREGERRVDSAVGLALVVRRHRQRGLGDGERAVDVADGVVARGVAARRDDVGADIDRALRRARVRERAAERQRVVGELEAGIGDAVAARVPDGVVNLRVVDRRNGERRRRDGQAVAGEIGERDGVVGGGARVARVDDADGPDRVEQVRSAAVDVFARNATERADAGEAFPGRERARGNIVNRAREVEIRIGVAVNLRRVAECADGDRARGDIEAEAIVVEDKRVIARRHVAGVRGAQRAHGVVVVRDVGVRVVHATHQAGDLVAVDETRARARRADGVIRRAESRQAGRAIVNVLLVLRRIDDELARRDRVEAGRDRDIVIGQHAGRGRARRARDRDAVAAHMAGGGDERSRSIAEAGNRHGAAGAAVVVNRASGRRAAAGERGRGDRVAVNAGAGGADCERGGRDGEAVVHRRDGDVGVVREAGRVEIDGVQVRNHRAAAVAGDVGVLPDRRIERGIEIRVASDRTGRGVVERRAAADVAEGLRAIDREGHGARVLHDRDIAGVENQRVADEARRQCRAAEGHGITPQPVIARIRGLHTGLVAQHLVEGRARRNGVTRQQPRVGVHQARRRRTVFQGQRTRRRSRRHRGQRQRRREGVNLVVQARRQQVGRRLGVIGAVKMELVEAAVLVLHGLRRALGILRVHDPRAVRRRERAGAGVVHEISVRLDDDRAVERRGGQRRIHGERGRRVAGRGRGLDLHRVAERGGHLAGRIKRHIARGRDVAAHAVAANPAAHVEVFRDRHVGPAKRVGGRAADERAARLEQQGVVQARAHDADGVGPGVTGRDVGQKIGHAVAAVERGRDGVGVVRGIGNPERRAGGRLVVEQAVIRREEEVVRAGTVRRGRGEQVRAGVERHRRARRHRRVRGVGIGGAADLRRKLRQQREFRARLDAPDIVGAAKHQRRTTRPRGETGRARRVEPGVRAGVAVDGLAVQVGDGAGMAIRADRRGGLGVVPEKIVVVAAGPDHAQQAAGGRRVGARDRAARIAARNGAAVFQRTRDAAHVARAMDRARGVALENRATAGDRARDAADIRAAVDRARGVGLADAAEVSPHRAAHVIRGSAARHRAHGVGHGDRAGVQTGESAERFLRRAGAVDRA